MLSLIFGARILYNFQYIQTSPKEGKALIKFRASRFFFHFLLFVYIALSKESWKEIFCLFHSLKCLGSFGIDIPGSTPHSTACNSVAFPKGNPPIIQFQLLSSQLGQSCNYVVWPHMAKWTNCYLHEVETSNKVLSNTDNRTH